ncbi:MAG TPA: hypothetical protein VEE82_03455 [Thermodesulfovibrionales bacterium]|nr:hypothetical protein [Thermodesulfovibrionales bacterium]
MSLKNLSEAIILQSAEDLLSVAHRKEGLEFFGGEGFRLAAEIACMTFDEKLDFLHMLLDCISSGKKMSQCSKEMLLNKEINRSRPPHRDKKGVLLSVV